MNNVLLQIQYLALFGGETAKEVVRRVLAHIMDPNSPGPQIHLARDAYEERITCCCVES